MLRDYRTQQFFVTDFGLFNNLLFVQRLFKYFLIAVQASVRIDLIYLCYTLNERCTIQGFLGIDLYLFASPFEESFVPFFLLGFCFEASKFTTLL